MIKVLEMLQLILKDLSEPFSYSITGFSVSGVVMGIYLVFSKVILKKKIPIGKTICWYLIFLYGYVLLQTTFFCRPSGSRIGVSLKIGETWGNSLQSKAYVLENILMTIPLGCLFPMVWKRMRKCWRCGLVAALVSVGIETTQLLTGRGYCQIDDVLTNVAGALLGWGIWMGTVSLKMYKYLLKKT